MKQFLLVALCAVALAVSPVAAQVHVAQEEQVINGSLVVPGQWYSTPGGDTRVFEPEMVELYPGEEQKMITTEIDLGPLEEGAVIIATGEYVQGRIGKFGNFIQEMVLDSETELVKAVEGGAFNSCQSQYGIECRDEPTGVGGCFQLEGCKKSIECTSSQTGNAYCLTYSSTCQTNYYSEDECWCEGLGAVTCPSTWLVLQGRISLCQENKYCRYIVSVQKYN